MNKAPCEAIYQARLTETGLAVEDSIVLCGEYCSTRDWLEVKSKALKENLLGKGSRSRTAKLLGAVERRIVHAAPPLDRPVPIARFLAAESKVPSAAKTQLLFVLAVNDDIALCDAFRELVVPARDGHAAQDTTQGRDSPLPDECIREQAGGRPLDRADLRTVGAGFSSRSSGGRVRRRRQTNPPRLQYVRRWCVMKSLPFLPMRSRMAASAGGQSSGTSR